MANLLQHIFKKSFRVYFNVENYTNDLHILSLVDLLFCWIVSASLELAVTFAKK